MFLYFNEKGLLLKEKIEKEYGRLQHVALQLNDEEFFIFYVKNGENNFKILKVKEDKFLVLKKVITLPQEYNNKVIDFFKKFYNFIILKPSQRKGSFRNITKSIEEMRDAFINNISATPNELFNKEVYPHNLLKYENILENFMNEKYVFKISSKIFKKGYHIVYWESIWLEKYMNKYSYKYYHGDSIICQTSQQVEDLTSLIKTIMEKLDLNQVKDVVLYNSKIQQKK